MEEFTPTDNQVFVNLINKEKKSAIFVIESSTNSMIGEAIAVGKKVREVKVGDVILFSNKGFSNFRSKEGQKFFIMDEQNILAVLERNNE